jgi:hypothetical protein
MLQFLWVYLWHITLVPFFLVVTKPFHSWTWHAYAERFTTTVLDIRYTITADEPLIPCGYILANHRSWTDFCLDPYVAKSCVVGRRMAFVAMNFATCLGLFDGIIISFVRGKETREQLFSRIKSHIEHNDTTQRALFFPEGTRMKYTHLASADELKTYLKYGMLKCIYEDKKYPVQLQISNNKDTVCDEKKWILNHGIPVHTHRSKSIHPKDFKTDTEFYDEIAKVWYECYTLTHADNDKTE